VDFKNYFTLLVNEATREEIKKFYPKISDKDYNTILDKDPTSTKDKVGNLSRLVLDLYKKDKFDINSEMLRDVYTALGLVQRKKHLLVSTEFAKFSNLNMIPDAKTLMDVNYYLNQLDNGKVKLKATDGLNVEIFYEDDNWVVKVPLDYQTSVRIGRDVGNATWCTASSKAVYYYNSYVSEDDLYIFINKHTNEAYQYFDHGVSYLTGEGVEFKNIKNNAADLKDFISKNKLESVLSKIQTESKKIQTSESYYAERLLKRYKQIKSPHMILMALNGGKSDDLIGKLLKIYTPDLNKKMLISIEEDKETYSTLNWEFLENGSKYTTLVPDSKEYVKAACEKFELENYIINSDLTVSSKGDISLGYQVDEGGEYPWSELPFKFKAVDGDFESIDIELESLGGFPEEVGGHFEISGCSLESLEGCPQKVGKSFVCTNNSLQSLEGSPEVINGDFDCSFNDLDSLEGCPKVVNGNFDCSENPGEFTKKDVRALCQVKGKIIV